MTTRVRLNKFVAQRSALSRRAADEAIATGRILVNGQIPTAGQQVDENDQVVLDGALLYQKPSVQTILVNKPTGYVVSHNGQGSKTIYDLLPVELHTLQAVGRLDKNSSGLLLLTSDGALAHSLTHPKYQKVKIYNICLDKELQPLHRQMINDMGIMLSDGLSRLKLERLKETGPDYDKAWQVTMHEGRNRQIRRTFEALGYKVKTLHRIAFGAYLLPTDLKTGEYISVD